MTTRSFARPPGPAPGLLVAAPSSGAGKTTVALGIARALARRGLRVGGVKNGPDYIDAAFLTAATGRPALNLDTLAMPGGLLAALAGEAAASCDILLAEGAMGLHDGSGPESGRTGSSADLAAAFGWPVVLVLDVGAQAQTAAAVALGLAAFDPRIRIAGVVLNRVASTRHRSLVEAGFARLDIPVLGALGRRSEGAALPSRHLGLVQARETADLDVRLDALADAAERGIDIDRLLALAGPTRTGEGGVSATALPLPGGRIAIARDDAFSFMYEHVLAGWRTGGATLLPFSPLADEAPAAEADCCWLPGGYPELHAARLAAASGFLGGLRRFAETRPVHGECGGYMVLGESLEDGEGRRHAMAGCLTLHTSFAARRLHLGYRIAVLESACALGQAGAAVCGHEFHYATILGEGSAPPDLARLFSPDGAPLGLAGHRRGRVSGSFFHAIAARDA